MVMPWLVGLALHAAAAGAPADTTALSVPGSAARPASWMRTGPSPKAHADGLAVGDHLAVARVHVGTWSGWYAHQKGGHVRGPLRVPGPAPAAWMGVGKDDVLYARTADGALYRGTLDGFLRGTATRLEDLGPLTASDAAGQAVIALGADGETVHVSVDQGRTFSTHGFGDPIRRVFARFDDVVVAFGRGAHTSTDGGASWRVTDLELDDARRTGAFIGEDKSDYNPGGRNCEQGALADDGHTFVVYGQGPPSVQSWQAVFDARASPHGQGERGWATSRTPGPPSAQGPRAVAAVAQCRADAERSGGGGIGRIGTGADRCSGFACLRAPPPPSSPREIVFLGDAGCVEPTAGVDAVRLAPWQRMSLSRRRWFVRPPPEARCGATSLDQVPTAWTLQADQAPVPVKVPAGCTPTRAFGAAGLSLLLCGQTGGQEVYSLGPHGFVREGRLDGRVRYLAQADDGTTLFAVRAPDGDLAAYVRAPRAPGEGAWARVSLPQAALYRPLPRGRALAMGPAPRAIAGSIKLRLGGLAPRAPADATLRSHGAAPVFEARALPCYEAAVTAHPALTGQGTLVVDVAASGAVTGARLVLDDDAGQDFGPVEACLRDAAAQMRLRLVSPAARRAVAGQAAAPIRLEATNLAAQVAVLEPGKGVQVLRDDIKLDAPVQDVRVRDGRVEADGGVYSTRFCPLPARGPFVCGP